MGRGGLVASPLAHDKGYYHSCLGRSRKPAFGHTRRQIEQQPQPWPAQIVTRMRRSWLRELRRRSSPQRRALLDSPRRRRLFWAVQTRTTIGLGSQDSPAQAAQPWKEAILAETSQLDQLKLCPGPLRADHERDWERSACRPRRGVLMSVLWLLLGWVLGIFRVLILDLHLPIQGFRLVTSGDQRKSRKFDQA